MPSPQKNILLICFDDALSFEKHRTVFNEPLQVPNLDRITSQASNFHSAYCQAPICGPSRASFMSARAPHQLGVLDNYTDAFDVLPASEMWSCRLKDKGYFCSSGGKLHHRYRPLRRVHHQAIYSDGQKPFSDDMHLPPDIEKKRFGGHRGGWGTTDPKDDGFYYDHQSADSAIAFLQNYDGDAPFYREVGFYSPHGPHYTPARFKEMYDVDNFQQPEEWGGGFDPHDWTDTHLPQNEHIKSGDLNWWRCSVRNYFAALSHGDYHLGRVWDALQASDHADDTIVIIISDHGFHLGNRNRYMKTTLWEQVAGVPLIIYDPDTPTRRDIDDPVSMLDLGPTVVDFADLPPLAHCIGRSLRPYLEGQGDPGRAVPTFYYDNVGVRCGDYRIIRYADDTMQLFNIKEDYWQLHDLGRDHPAFTEMYHILHETCAAHGLDLPEA